MLSIVKNNIGSLSFCKLIWNKKVIKAVAAPAVCGEPSLHVVGRNKSTKSKDERRRQTFRCPRCMKFIATARTALNCPYCNHYYCQKSINKQDASHTPSNFNATNTGCSINETNHTITRATTGAVDQGEDLTQKVEKIVEPEPVMAQNPVIDEAKPPPKILSEGPCKVHSKKVNESKPDKNVVGDESLNEIAKIVMNSPANKVDERLLKELEKLGVPTHFPEGSLSVKPDVVPIKFELEKDCKDKPANPKNTSDDTTNPIHDPNLTTNLKCNPTHTKNKSEHAVPESATEVECGFSVNIPTQEKWKTSIDRRNHQDEIAPSLEKENIANIQEEANLQYGVPDAITADAAPIAEAKEAEKPQPDIKEEIQPVRQDEIVRENVEEQTKSPTIIASGEKVLDKMESPVIDKAAKVIQSETLNTVNSKQTNELSKEKAETVVNVKAKHVTEKSDIKKTLYNPKLAEEEANVKKSEVIKIFEPAKEYQLKTTKESFITDVKKDEQPVIYEPAKVYEIKSGLKDQPSILQASVFNVDEEKIRQIESNLEKIDEIAPIDIRLAQVLLPCLDIPEAKNICEEPSGDLGLLPCHLYTTPDAQIRETTDLSFEENGWVLPAHLYVPPLSSDTTATEKTQPNISLENSTSVGSREKRKETQNKKGVVYSPANVILNEVNSMKCETHTVIENDKRNKKIEPKIELVLSIPTRIIEAQSNKQVKQGKVKNKANVTNRSLISEDIKGGETAKYNTPNVTRDGGNDNFHDPAGYSMQTGSNKTPHSRKMETGNDLDTQNFRILDVSTPDKKPVSEIHQDTNKIEGNQKNESKTSDMSQIPENVKPSYVSKITPKSILHSSEITQTPHNTDAHYFQPNERKERTADYQTTPFNFDYTGYGGNLHYHQHYNQYTPYYNADYSGNTNETIQTMQHLKETAAPVESGYQMHPHQEYKPVLCKSNKEGKQNKRYENKMKNKKCLGPIPCGEMGPVALDNTYVSTSETIRMDSASRRKTTDKFAYNTSPTPEIRVMKAFVNPLTVGEYASEIEKVRVNVAVSPQESQKPIEFQIESIQFPNPDSNNIRLSELLELVRRRSQMDYCTETLRMHQKDLEMKKCGPSPPCPGRPPKSNCPTPDCKPKPDCPRPKIQCPRPPKPDPCKRCIGFQGMFSSLWLYPHLESTGAVQGMMSEGVITVREFDPWVPIPSWPHPDRKVPPKKRECPQKCKGTVPDMRKRCLPKDCYGFPKRRKFSLAEWLGSQYGSLAVMIGFSSCNAPTNTSEQNDT